MSSDVDINEGWIDFFKANQSVLPHPSRCVQLTETNSFPFCCCIQSIELMVPIQAPTQFQLRVTFYDAENHCFFGSTWSSPNIISDVVKSGLHLIKFEEPLYFHTTVNDLATLVVIEVVLATEVLQVVGWSWVRIFSQYESLTDVNETVQPLKQKVDLYHGSSTALMFIQEPIEEHPNLKKMSGQVFYTLETHEDLQQIVHLVPQNVILNGDDIVPGVVEDETEGNGIIDILRSPETMKTWPFHFEKVFINLFPNVDQFEEELCLMLRRNVSYNVKIVERKLRVGVHNGWQFIKTPHLVYVEKTFNTQTTKRKTPDSTISNPTKECSGLTLQSRLELNEMVNHPLFAVLFQLEYVVSITQAKQSNSAKTVVALPSKKVDVAIRNVVWVPFEGKKKTRKNHYLELQADLGCNVFHSTLFDDVNHFPRDQPSSTFGSIEFDLNQSRLKKHPVGNLTNQFENTLGVSEPILSSKPASPYHQHLDEVNQPLHSTQLAGTRAVAADISYEPQQLNALPHTQTYSPLIIAPNMMARSNTLSRVHHSLLYTVPYPQITDTQGNVPFVLDPNERMKYDINVETRDSLHANEVILQFLAMSRCSHRTVFFTFQFYRFPQTTSERLHLQETGDDSTNHLGHMPCIIQKMARDGNVSMNSTPGLMIKYTLDPAFMQPNEQVAFLRYMLQQRLYIDVWDGDSLLLIGSTSLELRYLLRQGKSAVQMSQELDVLFYEHTENNPMLAGDHNTNPTGTKVSLEATLFLRVANVGSLPDQNTEKLKALSQSLQLKVGSPERQMFAGRSVAKLMSDCDAELATILMTRKTDSGKTTKMEENAASEARKRKVDRMKAVRQLRGGEEVPSMYILQKEEKIQRTRDLRTIQYFRDNCRDHGLQSKLEEHITVHHMLHSSLGRAEFFEFTLKNPFPNDQSVTITTSDPDLQVVVNSLEWRHYRKMTDIKLDVEEQMFSSAKENVVKMFVSGNEKVDIPMKFQSLTAVNLTPEMGPPHPLGSENFSYSLQTFGKDTTLSSKDIRVDFHGNDNKLLAILCVRVELHPHAIDQTFRFYHPEQSFLKKSIRLPPLHTLPGSSASETTSYNRVVALCSDDAAICETHQVHSGEPQEVFIKVPCGVSPNVRRFFVVVFTDEYCSKPCQIWQIYVHSLQRIDISATEGQSSRFSVLLKGTQTSRMVKCFSSHPNELQVSPQTAFMLLANGVQEVCLNLNPLGVGKRMMFVNVVDQEFHQLIKSWLVMATCSVPIISKSFQVNMRIGACANKKISFTNPYPIKRNFYFSSNRDDLLKLKETALMLGGGEVHNLGLTFCPQQCEGSATIFIFINDRDGKNEETFSVKTTYS